MNENSKIYIVRKQDSHYGISYYKFLFAFFTEHDAQAYIERLEAKHEECYDYVIVTWAPQTIPETEKIENNTKG